MADEFDPTPEEARNGWTRDRATPCRVSIDYDRTEQAGHRAVRAGRVTATRPS
jgi:hypothetical protein